MRLPHYFHIPSHRSLALSSPTLSPLHSSNRHAFNPDCTLELIFAIDVFQRQKLILSRVVETEMKFGWFRCSPFQVDLLDPENSVKTTMKYPRGEEACENLS
ncbi:F-box protein [Sesbania bispinosa]|nr:F-box protein [Sesbania bispinosa]